MKLNIDKYLTKEEALVKELDELKLLLEQNKKYYSKSTIEYLKALLSLDTSVVRENNYNEFLENIELFKEIAKYNILKRARKVLENSELVRTDKLIIKPTRNIIVAKYDIGDNQKLGLFDADFRDKPTIKLFCDVPLEEKERNIKETITGLENKVYGRDDRLVGFNEKNEPVYENLYGGPNSYLRELKRQEILKNYKELEEIKSINRYTYDEKLACEQVLLEDWGLSKNNTESKILTKTNNWIKVFKEEK